MSSANLWGRFQISLSAAVIDVCQGALCKGLHVRKNTMLQAVFATGAGSLARAEPRLVAHLNTRPLSAAAMSFRALPSMDGRHAVKQPNRP